MHRHEGHSRKRPNGRDAEVHKIRPGDVAFIEPDEGPWHDATRTGSWLMSPIGGQARTAVSVTWLDHVTDEECPR